MNNSQQPPYNHNRPQRPACKVTRHSRPPAQPGGRCQTLNVAGLVVMAAGILILLFCVPFWFWPLAIGAALLAIGFMLLHK